MELGSIGKNIDIESLIRNIRSENKSDRQLTISQIPNLILESLKHKNEVLNQLILVIYNLNTDLENHETLNASNRTLVIRHLLRLYSDNTEEHGHTQIDALTKIINLVHSPELLVELAYAFSQCSEKVSKNDTDLVEEALGIIQEKAAANLYPEVLLMIHSITAMK